MRVVAVINQKGGCGKTTVAINLASALAESGQRTLLVDIDPQSHCAVGLAVPEEQIEQSIYDVLISKCRNEPLRITEILWQIADNFELAPASIDLAAFEQQMTDVPEKESCLKNCLNETKKEFDFAVIDCPPAVGLLTFNALDAATDCIVPVDTGYFALHGLSRQLETLDILCQRTKRNINVRVLASMYDIRTKMAREILGELRAHFGEKMFATVVNFNTKIKEAASYGQPIGEYDPASKGQYDFRVLAEEVINLKTKQQKHEFVNSLTARLDQISMSASELLNSTKIPTTPKPKIIETLPPAVPANAKINDNISIPSTQPHVSPPQTAKNTSATTQTEPEKEHQNKSDILDKKLSNYYGVTQLKDAVLFVTLYPRAAKIQLAGDFNNWLPAKTEMQRVGTSGVWHAKIKLPPGKHRYRLVVDGHWQQDPYNENTEINSFGEYNSIIEIK